MKITTICNSSSHRTLCISNSKSLWLLRLLLINILLAEHFPFTLIPLVSILNLLVFLVLNFIVSSLSFSHPIVNVDVSPLLPDLSSYLIYAWSEL